MLKLVGTFGLGGLFLAVSPELRTTVMNALEAFSTFLTTNSPLSYVGVGAVILIGAMFWVYRAAQPR